MAHSDQLRKLYYTLVEVGLSNYKYKSDNDLWHVTRVWEVCNTAENLGTEYVTMVSLQNEEENAAKALTLSELVTLERELVTLEREACQEPQE